MSKLVVIQEEDLKKIVSEAVSDALSISSNDSSIDSNFGIPHKRYLNIKELSKVLDVPVNTLYQYNHLGKIPYIYRFKKVLYDWEDIQKWLKEGSVKLKKHKNE